VRDFGSLNGTHVNDELIGKRAKHLSPRDGQKLEFLERDLNDGDQLRVYNVVFRISIHVPAVCDLCGNEIAHQDMEFDETGGSRRVCDDCRTEAIASSMLTADTGSRCTCVRCGKDVSAEHGANRGGEFVCSACKSDPFKIMKKLLAAAKSGHQDLAAILGYEILKPLGKGGMGSVYLVRHEATGERCALKLMLPKTAARASCRALFLREAENTQALQHPNIVQFREACYSGGVFFFTMEYCDDQGVDQLLVRRKRPLSVAEATEIILPCLDGLEYAHHAPIPQVRLIDGTFGRGAGLVHRDISPQNILLDRSHGTLVPKIADFGLSKAFDLAGLSGLTCSGNAAGKPYFMCRQQLIDYRFAKPEVDVWAIAATLYAMLTGYPPRDFSGEKDLWRTVLEETPIPIQDREPRIPVRLAQVIDDALADHGQLAFQSAREFKSALEVVL
jgi:serine/threonine-protein kinase